MGEGTASADSVFARPVEHPRVLVVEGGHEEHFFATLLCAPDMQGVGPLDVQAIGGKGNITAGLLALAKDGAWLGFYDGGHELSLGVVRDADECAVAAFEAVTGALRHAGFPVPAGPEQAVTGELRSEGGPTIQGVTVSVFIMPGQGRLGALEDLCMEAVAGDPRTDCVERLFACIEEKGEAITAPPSAHKLGKARAHAFLATQKEPDVHVGLGARKHYWPLDSPAFDPLKDFLRRLAASGR